MKNLKKEAARSAVSFIKDNSIVGLGAGSTVACMVDFISSEVKNGLKLQLVTASYTTSQLLLQKGMAVQPLSSFDFIDIYFDGCDQFDKNLHALKCGGGIHTREKLLASMASAFFLVGDHTKYAEQLQTTFPLVIELLPDAARYVQACLQKIFPGTRMGLRMSDKYDGPAITANGNYLLDIWFRAWPVLKGINETVKEITGVVETSLFYNLAHKAIIAAPEQVTIMERPVIPLVM